MHRSKRQKKKEIQTEWFVIEVEDWEVALHFGLNPSRRDTIEGDYAETTKLVLAGRILSPAMPKAARARIELVAAPEMDDHWKAKPATRPAKAIGSMDLPRGEDSLIFFCWIPDRFHRNISIALQSGRLQFVSIFGSKLKWGKGTFSSINLSNDRELISPD